MESKTAAESDELEDSDKVQHSDSNVGREQRVDGSHASPERQTSRALLRSAIIRDQIYRTT